MLSPRRNQYRSLDGGAGMDEAQDPYRPPGWASSGTPLTAELPKTSVLVMILLMVVTLGLYIPFWFLRRRKILNQLSPERRVDGWIAALVALYVGAFVLGLVAGLVGAPPGQTFLLWARFVEVGRGILTLVLGFQVKAILEENYPDHISGVGTFFLSIFYLQYKVNRLQPKGASGSILGLGLR